MFVSDISDDSLLYDLAQKIRFHSAFHPHGINVNFLRINSDSEISVVTYEKGVEKIMQSCGSGSVAAAFYAYNIDKMKCPINIINKGGKMSLQYNENWDINWLSSNPVLELKTKMNF